MEITQALSRNYEFLRAYRRGKSIVSKYFVLYYLKNRSAGNRLGITASKKIGNAVSRNRARRILKESYRKQEYRIKSGFDIVLVARKRTVTANQILVEKIFIKELQRTEMWNDDV